MSLKINLYCSLSGSRNSPALALIDDVIISEFVSRVTEFIHQSAGSQVVNVQAVFFSPASSGAPSFYLPFRCYRPTTSDPFLIAIEVSGPIPMPTSPRVRLDNSVCEIGERSRDRLALADLSRRSTSVFPMGTLSPISAHPQTLRMNRLQGLFPPRGPVRPCFLIAGRHCAA